eukprot:m.28851 g.28851  ORF g.28851 m.28851 type:complete len:73 (+) comp31073_c0_seq4:182-400(+)
MNSAALPTALEDVQGDSRWMDIHERFVKLAKTSQARVVFFGDSITRLMEDTDVRTRTRQHGKPCQSSSHPFA